MKEEFKKEEFEEWIESIAKDFEGFLGTIKHNVSEGAYKLFLIDHNKVRFHP